MSKPLFIYTDGSELHALSAKIIATRIDVWEANRVRDEAHVLALEESIKNPEDIQGPFSVAQYLDESGAVFRIIDGQHRQEVLRRYFEKNPEAEDFKVLTRRYYVENRDNIVDIFQRINHAKPMVYKGSSTEKLHEMVIALQKAFLVEGPKGLVQLIRPNCNRPALSVELLEEGLKRYEVHEKNLTPAELVAHAVKMNEYYREDPNRLPGIKVTANILAKALDLGFYLGLDSKCAWLTM